MSGSDIWVAIITGILGAIIGYLLDEIVDFFDDLFF